MFIEVTNGTNRALDRQVLAASVRSMPDYANVDSDIAVITIYYILVHSFLIHRILRNLIIVREWKRMLHFLRPLIVVRTQQKKVNGVILNVIMNDNTSL